MQPLPAYSVISSGEIKPGYNLPDVQEAFSSLFKISPDKAQAFLGVKRVIKKDLDLEAARTFVQRLENIGLNVTMQQQKPPRSESSLELALEPTGDEPDAVLVKEDARITCPKCNLEQTRAAQCSGCGVYFDKVAASPGTERNTKPQRDSSAKVQSSSHDAQKTSSRDVESTNDLLAIGAGAAAALVGAFVWKFIAVAFGFELGLVAWIVGGAVGFTAAMFGSRGEVLGAICGALTLVAILGGKYMTIESYQSDLSQTIATFSEEEKTLVMQAYEEALKTAGYYSENVVNEQSLRQFMVDYNYSEYYETEDVTADEIAEFKQTTEQQLKNMAYQKPTYEQWLEAGLKEGLENYSTMDLIIEDFGLMDLLFLALGVTTAFRLGCGNRSV